MLNERCDQCRDLGILRVYSQDQADMESLVYCGCGRPYEPVWRLPMLSRRMREAFRVEKVPLAWFLPDNDRGSVPVGSLIASVDAKVHDWTDRLRKAEKFWEQWGTIFDDPKNHMEGR